MDLAAELQRQAKLLAVLSDAFLHQQGQIDRLAEQLSAQRTAFGALPATYPRAGASTEAEQVWPIPDGPSEPRRRRSNWQPKPSTDRTP